MPNPKLHEMLSKPQSKQRSSKIKYYLLGLILLLILVIFWPRRSETKLVARTTGCTDVSSLYYIDEFRPDSTVIYLKDGCHLYIPTSIAKKIKEDPQHGVIGNYPIVHCCK